MKISIGAPFGYYNKQGKVRDYSASNSIATQDLCLAEGPRRVPGISLSWPDGGHCLSNELFEDAKFCWCHLIVPISYYRVYTWRPCQCHLCTSTDPPGERFRFPLSDSQIFDVLRQVNFSRLYHGYLSRAKEWMNYISFLRWLFDLSVGYFMLLLRLAWQPFIILSASRILK